MKVQVWVLKLLKISKVCINLQNFYSKSIHGEYDNVIYDVFVDDNSPYRLDYIECWPGGKTPQDGHSDKEGTPLLFFPNHRE